MSAVPSTTDAWVAYLDVYGFSALVRASREEMDRLSESLARAQAATQAEIDKRKDPAKLLLFSDSLFLTYPVGGAGRDHVRAALHKCLEDVAAVLERFCREALPLRGGIAFGRVGLGPNLLVGDPVIRAAEYEKLLVAPLVLLPEVELERAQCSDPQIRRRPQLVSVRDGGIIKARVIAPRNLERYRKFVAERLDRAAVEGPYDTTRAWVLAAELLQQHRKVDG